MGRCLYGPPRSGGPMGRANNTSRSLHIISKLNGWDPSKIDGADYPNSVYDENERMQGFKAGTLPRDPQEPCPDPSPPGPDTRTPFVIGGRSGKHNPNAGK